MATLEAIVHDDPSILCLYGINDEDDSIPIGGSEGGSLLHQICESHGWTDEIKFVLKEIIRHNSRHDDNGFQHEGLFHENDDFDMPLILSLQAGSNLTDIVEYLRDQYPAYLEANLNRVSKIIAEYELDMQLLSDLIRLYDERLLNSTHSRNGSCPLSFACYYQNEAMLRCLLQEYFDCFRRSDKAIDTYDTLLRVQNHLLKLNNDNMSPLGYILLNIGDADAENAWRCIDCCVGFFAGHESEYLKDEKNFARPQQRFRFLILHLFLSQSWDQAIAKRNCMKIVDQIVNRLEIDVCIIDKETGNTVLSIVIRKLAMSCSVNNNMSDHKMSLQILNYFVHPSDVVLSNSESFPAMTRDESGRLPLHLACEYSLPWEIGLGIIANENLTAIESHDPTTGLPPFAHCAVGDKSDLTSIYQLLRLFPSSIDAITKYKLVC